MWLWLGFYAYRAIPLSQQVCTATGLSQCGQWHRSSHPHTAWSAPELRIDKKQKLRQKIDIWLKPTHNDNCAPNRSVHTKLKWQGQISSCCFTLWTKNKISEWSRILEISEEVFRLMDKWNSPSQHLNCWKTQIIDWTCYISWRMVSLSYWVIT